MPTVTTHKFGKGTGVYMSSFKHGEVNNRTLLNLILTAAGESTDQKYLTDNVNTECCYYPEGNSLLLSIMRIQNKLQQLRLTQVIRL